MAKVPNIFADQQGSIPLSKLDDNFAAFQGSDSNQGAALVNFIQSQGGTSSVARTVQEKLSDIFSVKDFGALGDGSTNDYAAIQACITAACSAGKSIFVPAGTYICGSQLTSSGHNFSLYGEGVATTKIAFTTSSGGLSVNLGAQGVSVSPQQFELRNITIESRATVSSPAVKAKWERYQPNAQGQLWIENVSITRKTDGTGSFSAGICLNGCIAGHVANCIILGDDNRVSDIGIQLIDCIEIKINKVDVNRYRTGVSITLVNNSGGTEYVSLHDCNFYDVWKGIESKQPNLALKVIGTEININGSGSTCAVDLANANQCFFSNCIVLYGGSSGDPTGQLGFSIVDSNGVVITNCHIVNLSSSRGDRAVTFLRGVGNMIANNIISLGSVGLTLSHSDNNQITGNIFYNNTVNISDSGTGNNKVTNVDHSGTPIGNVRWGTSAGSFSAGEISTDSNWGAYIRGRGGVAADLALVDSFGNAKVQLTAGQLVLQVPTSPAGLTSGMIWNDSGTLKIIP